MTVNDIDHYFMPKRLKVTLFVNSQGKVLKEGAHSTKFNELTGIDVYARIDVYGHNACSGCPGENSGPRQGRPWWVFLATPPGHRSQQAGTSPTVYGCLRVNPGAPVVVYPDHLRIPRVPLRRLEPAWITSVWTSPSKALLCLAWLLVPCIPVATHMGLARHPA